MKVEVSVGEAIDKLSILELKRVKITDEHKRIEIQKEIHELAECQSYKTKFELYYAMLMYVNEKIWDLTDVIKGMTMDNVAFAYISHQIFELNQKRFRIKNWFNLRTSSTIKEQKSYASNGCTLIVENEDIFFNKLPEIHYLAIEYDVITIQSPILPLIQDFLKIPTILYEEKPFPTIHLSEFSIPTESREVFCAKPISYIIGGLFGDFIQCLSIVNEKFYETGRKGIIHLSNRGDPFRNGLENTFADTYDIISKQPYVHEYKIFQEEPIDVDLVAWRDSPLLFNNSMYEIFLHTYGIEWGKRKWLNVPTDETWKNKVMINTTHYRWPIELNFARLQELHSNELIFISASKEEHLFFEQNAFCVEYHQVTSFVELATMIHSCKLFVGSLSAPLSIAHALHKDRVCGVHTPMGGGPGDVRMNENLFLFTNLRYNI